MTKEYKMPKSTADASSLPTVFLLVGSFVAVCPLYGNHISHRVDGSGPESLTAPEVIMKSATDYPKEPRDPIEGPPNEGALRMVEEISEDCAMDDWDGEGADRVPSESVVIARNLVANLPPHALTTGLDIDATPFGSIDFEWVLETEAMLNILILPSGELGFAYSVREDVGEGKVRWEGSIPTPIAAALNRVFEQ